MKLEEFEKYQFSVNTVIKRKGLHAFYEIYGTDFEKKLVEIREVGGFVMISFSEIEKIGEVK